MVISPIKQVTIFNIYKLKTFVTSILWQNKKKIIENKIMIKIKTFVPKNILYTWLFYKIAHSFIVKTGTVIYLNWLKWPQFV